MLRRNLWILALCVLASLKAMAQYDPSFSHYWAIEPSYNPGAVGKQEKLNFAAVYNMTMAGFENNPRTIYAGLDAPFYFAGIYHGVGVQFLNDQIGLFSHRSFSLQYAFKLKLLGGQLSIGVQPAMLSENFDGSKLDLAESNDPAFTTSEITGTAFDLSAGIYYQHRHWYVGASSKQVLAPTVEMGETN